MLSAPEASTISNLFYLLDMNVRNDLCNKRIADERDYVSRLVTFFNYPFGVFNHYLLNNIRFKSKWYSIVNKAPEEQKFGCDSMIVFRVKDTIKIGLFESKWPRVIINPTYNWDYAQKSTKESHFTHQIKRQSKWTNIAAIWEMFCYEEKVGTATAPFDINGSTCVRHEYAIQLINTTSSLNTLWDNDDLVKLIQTQQAVDGITSTNINEIIFDILTCRFGKAIEIDSNAGNFTLNSNDNEVEVNCPIVSMEDNNDINQVIDGFMRKNGLSFFQQVNIIIDNQEDE